jgi:hypothetical protein
MVFSNFSFYSNRGEAPKFLRYYISKTLGDENRRVYRWNFNPIFVPYLKVSGVRNDEQRHWHLTPDTRHTERNKYGIFFKAILWAILIIPG